MVQELKYSTVNQVLSSWEHLRRIKNYEETAGVKLFQRLFISCPEVKPLFGFPLNTDASSEEVLKSKRFKMHAAYIIGTIDTALNMLGPDIELLTEMLFELGERHVRYGVKPSYFPFLGTSLIATIDECLDGKFTVGMKAAWEEVYLALSSDMIAGQRKKLSF